MWLWISSAVGAQIAFAFSVHYWAWRQIEGGQGKIPPGLVDLDVVDPGVECDHTRDATAPVANVNSSPPEIRQVRDFFRWYLGDSHFDHAK
jgi:hypothetical protein